MTGSSDSFVDFSFYESMKEGSRGSESPLEKLLKQSGAKSRNSETLVADEPDSWDIVRVDLKIAD